MAEASSLCSSLETDQVSPDGVSLPHNVLPQVGPEVTLREILVAAGDNSRIRLDHLVDVFLQHPGSVISEGVSGVDRRIHIFWSQPAVDDLVELFEYLAETSLVQLCVGFQFAK